MVLVYRDGGWGVPNSKGHNKRKEGLMKLHRLCDMAGAARPRMKRGHIRSAILRACGISGSQNFTRRRSPAPPRPEAAAVTTINDSKIFALIAAFAVKSVRCLFYSHARFAQDAETPRMFGAAGY